MFVIAVDLFVSAGCPGRPGAGGEQKGQNVPLSKPSLADEHRRAAPMP